MTTKLSIHELAKQLLAIYRSEWEQWSDENPTCPAWIAQKIIQSKRKATLKKAARQAMPKLTGHKCMRRIYADRCEERDQLAAICAGLRRVTGLVGSPLRKLALAVRARRLSQPADLSCVDLVPDHAVCGLVGGIRAKGVYDSGGGRWGVRTVRWAESFHPGFGLQSLILMALTDAVRMDIGELDARREIARLEQDPSATISGYLADDLSKWVAGCDTEEGQYEGCSGGEYYTWFRRHREHWPLLLSRCPVGKSGDTWIQCYPHEHTKAAACRAAGLRETMGMSHSVWSGTAEQVSAATR